MFPRNPQGAQAPDAPDDETAQRWEEGRRRRRLLDGVWRPDLEAHLQRHLGSVRREAWGPASLASNVFESVCSELSVLYDVEPEIAHERQATVGIERQLRLSGLWGLMARVQRYCTGLREMLVRAHVDEGGRLRFRPVYPDLVWAWAPMDAPDQPSVVHEYRLREREGRAVWTVDELDIRDPDAPIYRVRALRGGALAEDLTVEFLGQEWSGEAYPYRRADGRPVLPYVLYHATRPGDRLWDPFALQEAVDGSLDLAVYSAFVAHAFRDSSWPQRYVVNLEPDAAETIDSDNGRRSELVTDPATIVVFRSIRDLEDSGQPMVGQFQPGADVEKMQGVVESMAASLATTAGVPPSDLQRMSSTARSGAAIALTNEGKRSAQRRAAVSFRDSDERLVALAAILLNRALGFGPGEGFAESGYQVRYKELPLSPEERKARREDVLAQLAAGLISKVDAYLELHPGLTREIAEQRLSEIEEPAGPMSTQPTAAAVEVEAEDSEEDQTEDSTERAERDLEVADEVQAIAQALAAALESSPSPEVEAYLRTALESVAEVRDLLAGED